MANDALTSGHAQGRQLGFKHIPGKVQNHITGLFIQQKQRTGFRMEQSPCGFNDASQNLVAVKGGADFPDDADQGFQAFTALLAGFEQDRFFDL